MIESVADARIDANELGLGTILFVELHNELLEGPMVSVEGLHVVVVAQQLGDGHDRVGERVLVGVLLGVENVVDVVVEAVAAIAAGAIA